MRWRQKHTDECKVGDTRERVNEIDEWKCDTWTCPVPRLNSCSSGGTRRRRGVGTALVFPLLLRVSHPERVTVVALLGEELLEVRLLFVRVRTYEWIKMRGGCGAGMGDQRASLSLISPRPPPLSSGRRDPFCFRKTVAAVAVKPNRTPSILFSFLKKHANAI